ncbi:MAG TPA: serine/threonine-protein kinase [Jatrophihabitans sp.]|nr:serine/threonine-protein kinase [Jatrophihabitans sp.]
MPAPAADGWLLADRYRVLDRIGSGGMAEVFRARDELLARDVAVKVFRRELDPAGSAGGAQRQEIELQVLAQLSHPNLITLFDGRIADTDGPNEPAYLVMELINGPSLAARIADGPLPEAEVRAIAIQICHALSYVHGKGMVHRDVKPANILLGSDDVGDPEQVDGAGQVREPGAGLRARLSDFGIVRLLDSAHVTNAEFMVGTASYLSPEQARGAEVGPPADVYALGLVLLEALTGERTFPGPAMTAVLARLDGPPPIPTTLPEPWPGVLAAMTATAPADRPSAEQVARTLSAGAAPVGLLAAADNTVRMAALPLPLDADQTKTLPVVTETEGLAAPGPAVPGTLTGVALAGQRIAEPAERRGGGWLPWLLAAIILITAAAVAVLVYRVLTVGSPASSPGSSTVPHSTPATTRATRTSHPASSASSRPASSSQSRPPTSTSTSSAPPTSSAVASSTPPASSSAATSTSASNSASGTATSTVTGGPASAPPTGTATSSSHP